ncbi:hypothetical protein AZE42_13251 [Rhizopogon vesiculosus]|uniref:Uncharacterized protein n=1 Tax=Rhizopogon vesiculosus TaxID=180088 RepID=A0A1J8QMJ0_9AGAM|nr:hypothetical protein AZE42_13251 [Rhizopogon vesiculosus]
MARLRSWMNLRFGSDCKFAL